MAEAEYLQIRREYLFGLVPKLAFLGIPQYIQPVLAGSHLR
jgi:hypothetical protein